MTHEQSLAGLPNVKIGGELPFGGRAAELNASPIAAIPATVKAEIALQRRAAARSPFQLYIHLAETGRPEPKLTEATSEGSQIRC